MSSMKMRDDKPAEGAPVTAMWLTVVGIGESGYAGLDRAPRRALWAARHIVGAGRHLALLPARLQARGVAWPSPFSLTPLHALQGQPVVALASGDPMWFGVGAAISREFPAESYTIWPGVSSIALAAARLRWPLDVVATLSLVGRPLASLNAALYAGERLIVLSADATTPQAVAGLLTARGFGASVMTVCNRLGGPGEYLFSVRADTWGASDSARVDALNVIGIHCIGISSMPGDIDASMSSVPITWGLTPGLPDDLFTHDGQLTKREQRAVTLAHLAPRPGEVLWDVGAGSGSIGIEWMRAHRRCQAIAIEANASRQALIVRNRDRFGVPGLRVIPGSAPEALEGLPQPDAIFIGGGVTAPGVLPRCWRALRPGGRLVANAVTLQSESLLVDWHARHGGELIRLTVSHAAPLGGFDVWRGALPLTIWAYTKGHADAGIDTSTASDGIADNEVSSTTSPCDRIESCKGGDTLNDCPGEAANHAS
ncbi:precorrin-6y C5,15-methyltransferase (decarboxylating) subunit CbiE [Robbsia andropogonis]|uniref:precorrin-6y C5,15-methyltransferase (decarboxylating) subunit CbiE n=1 Tax=Robbsia andropogonis TaxID=28092 RepID=UPI002A6B7158|nr:precorrin-6y C5,15-methyltransferase (decarboxylating) subunit CbiE [Robbsia andropogonis]